VNDCVGFGIIHSTSGSTFSLHIATQIASYTIIGTLKVQIYYKGENFIGHLDVRHHYWGNILTTFP